MRAPLYRYFGVVSLAEIALAAGIALAVAAIGLTIAPVGDDWVLLSQIEVWRQKGVLFTESWKPQFIHWSPLWFLTNGLCYSLAVDQFGAIPLALTRFAGLTILILAGISFMRRAMPSRLAIVAGAVLLGFNQAGVGALLQWKSIGSILAHAAGAVNATMIIGRLHKAAVHNGVGIAPALLIFAGLLFKETALSWGVFAGILLVAGIASSAEERSRAVKVAGPTLLACGLFLLLRYLVGTPVSLARFGGEMGSRYQIAGPVQWTKNAVLLFGAVATPISTVRWIDALRQSKWEILAVYGVITLIVCVYIARGLLLAAASGDVFNRQLVAISLAGLTSSAFPVLLMSHVSEGYVTPCVFWISTVFALSINGFVGSASLSVRGKGLAQTILFVSLALHVLFFVDKSTMMANSGRRNVQVMQQALVVLRELPQGSTVCIHTLAPSNAYSFYRVFDAEMPIAFGVVRERLPILLTDESCREHVFIEENEEGTSARIKIQKQSANADVTAAGPGSS